MKSIKSKLIVFVFLIVCVLGISTESQALNIKYNGGTKKIENDRDMANWAEQNPQQFLSGNWEEKVGKTIAVYYRKFG